MSGEQMNGNPENSQDEIIYNGIFVVPPIPEELAKLPISEQIKILLERYVTDLEEIGKVSEEILLISAKNKIHSDTK